MKSQQTTNAITFLTHCNYITIGIPTLSIVGNVPVDWLRDCVFPLRNETRKVPKKRDLTF